MKLRLPYGEHGLDVEVPDTATVLEPAVTPPLPHPAGAVRDALASPMGSAPLARIARPGQKAAIVVSDVTRPVPNATILPPILETIEAAGVARDHITIVVATGLHRPSRPDEHLRMLGEEIPGRYRVVDHVAKDRSTQEHLLTTARGVDVWLNRDYLRADLRIVTGFVEPHLFAGYSGGAKGVMPGIAGAATIMANHAAAMIGHHRATWCVTDGNPIFEEMRDIALMAAPSFLLNVTLDPQKRITGVFAGELVAAHDAAIAQAERQAVRPIPHPFDVVIATNMGYPADLILYQSVKGMSVAAQACAPGGTIMLVAECREGLGGEEYVELMRSEASPQGLLDRFGSEGHRTVPDQWGVQVQAMLQARYDCWLHSAVPQADVEAFHLRHAPDVSSTLVQILREKRRSLGREPTVCVLPHGQLTVPKVVTE